MNFRPQRAEQPDLNLIPLIDVLIVLLIFLVLTTTFNREKLLNINLPSISKSPTATHAEKIDAKITINLGAQNDYRVENHPFAIEDTQGLIELLKAAGTGKNSPHISIRADKATPYDAVLRILNILNQEGYRKISFHAIESAPDVQE